MKRLNDDNINRKMQGYWIIELTEMTAITNAKSIEETKAFISAQKETYKVPYDIHPKDKPRQCVFCGASNDMQFLPVDWSGNRRVAPVRVAPENAEVFILENEEESRNYILQMWAEAMVIYRTGKFRLIFDGKMENYARYVHKDLMQEDTDLGMVEMFLEEHFLHRICVKQIYCEVYMHNISDNLPIWESKRIADILRTLGLENVGIRRFREYGSQKAWVTKISPAGKLMMDL